MGVMEAEVKGKFALRAATSAMERVQVVMLYLQLVDDDGGARREGRGDRAESRWLK